MLGSFSAAMKSLRKMRWRKTGEGFLRWEGESGVHAERDKKGSERRAHLAGLFQIGKLGSSKIAM
jgi:hypothetical protein